MSWNDPENKDNKKDPWGRRNDDQGPPDIDEALKQVQKKLKTLLGGKGGGSNGQQPFGVGKPPLPNAAGLFGSPKGFLFVGLILVAIYLLSGIYIVKPAEQAVVTRLGKYIETTNPGPHWILPGVESKQIVNVQRVDTTERGNKMLTEDENIVDARIAVQYRVNNPENFLFNIVDPVETVRQVTESALRQVVGNSSLNDVLTSGRSEITIKIRKSIQDILDRYQSGIAIVDVALQQTKAPEEVREAFDDAIKAQQDEERLVNEAEAYSRKILPIAQGQAKRVLEEAKAYREQVILGAEGKTAKFAQVLPEYQKAPNVTRERMYIDALQSVYTNTPKVLVDAGNNNLLYVPLEKMLSNRSEIAQSSENTKADNVSRTTDYQKPSATAMSNQRGGERPSYDDMERPTNMGA